jgi:hypothetical protein
VSIIIHFLFCWIFVHIQKKIPIRKAPEMSSKKLPISLKVISQSHVDRWTDERTDSQTSPYPFYRRARIYFCRYIFPTFPLAKRANFAWSLRLWNKFKTLSGTEKFWKAIFMNLYCVSWLSLILKFYICIHLWQKLIFQTHFRPMSTPWA